MDIVNENLRQALKRAHAERNWSVVAFVLALLCIITAVATYAALIARL